MSIGKPTNAQLGQIISAAEIAEMCGVSRSAVSNWRARHDDFPEALIDRQQPYLQLYWKPDILEWLHRRDIPLESETVTCVNANPPTGT